MIKHSIEESRRLQNEVNCANKCYENDKDIIYYHTEVKQEKIKEEEKKELDELNKKHEELILKLEEMFPVHCDHAIVIKSHDSMLTGSTQGLRPNPNHVSYYCLGCGKKMTYEEIAPWNNIIDLFGHPDSLLVGKKHHKAIVDFLRYRVYRISKNNPTYTDGEIAKRLEETFDRVPEKFIRKK